MTRIIWVHAYDSTLVRRVSYVRALKQARKVLLTSLNFKHLSQNIDGSSSKVEGIILRKVATILFAFLVITSFSISEIKPVESNQSTISSPRSINLYILGPLTDSPSWYLGTPSNVVTGINQAVSDAAGSLVKLTGEQVITHQLSSTADLYSLVMNPPARAVVVNAMGEVIPTPNRYFGPAVNIASPTDGGSYTSFPSIGAWVYPPPGSVIDMSTLCCNPGYVLYTLVWFRVTSTSGYDSGWSPTSGAGNTGGYFQGSIASPAYGTYTIYMTAFANGYQSTAHVTITYNPPPSGGGGGGCGCRCGCPFRPSVTSNLVTTTTTSTGGSISVYADWTTWFNLLQDRMRNHGWVWANVAGYSGFYFGNSWYDQQFIGSATDLQSLGSLLASDQQPHMKGLQTLLGNPGIWAYAYDGHQAKRDADFISRSGFDPGIYKHLPTTPLGASRPLPQGYGLPWNTVGMTDTTTGDYAVASTTMNGTVTGSFIHSGLALDVDLDGVQNTANDDFLKGYISGMLAIEEGRAFLVSPTAQSHIVVSNTLYASFSVAMLPGGWGVGAGTFGGVSHLYRYVDLVVTIPSHYEGDYTHACLINGCYDDWYSLSVTDFSLSGSDPNVWGHLDLTRSGWVTGTSDRRLLDAIGWWQVGLAVDALTLVFGVPYLGSAVGLIPLLSNNPATPDGFHPDDSAVNGVYAKGTTTDNTGRHWGTVSYFIEVRFLYNSPPTNYAFTLSVTTWIEHTEYYNNNPNFYHERELGLTETMQLQFTVTG